jgi:hypothetical protein
MNSYFTVKPHSPSGYDISIGVGRIFYARSMQEVIYALSHYFRVNIEHYTGDPNKKYDYDGHLNHSKECDCCPLCRKLGVD